MSSICVCPCPGISLPVVSEHALSENSNAFYVALGCIYHSSSLHVLVMPFPVWLVQAILLFVWPCVVLSLIAL